ncbi:MAG: hypothetical protein ACOH5I_26440 [Oligoflexus sp.]
MAYVQNFDEDEKKNEQDGTATGEKVIASSLGGQQAPGAAAAPTEKKDGGRTANLQDYTQSNKQRSGEFVNDFTGDIKSQGESVQGAQNEFVKGVNEKVKPGGPQIDQAEIDKVKAGDAGGVDTDTWEQAYEAVYGGPESAASVEGWEDTNKKANEFYNTADQAQTFEGRGEILKNQQQNRDYTRGQNWLDSFLLTSADNSADAFQGIENQFGGARDAWQSQQDTINANITKAQEQTEAQKEAIRQAVEQGSTVVSPEAAKRLEDEKAYWKNEFGDIQGDDVMQKLQSVGIDPMYAFVLQDMGVNLGDYVDMSGYSADNFADPDRTAGWNQLLSALGMEQKNAAQYDRKKAMEGFNREKLLQDIQSYQANRG